MKSSLIFILVGGVGAGFGIGHSVGKVGALRMEMACTNAQAVAREAQSAARHAIDQTSAMVERLRLVVAQQSLSGYSDGYLAGFGLGRDIYTSNEQTSASEIAKAFMASYFGYSNQVYWSGKEQITKPK